MGAYWSTPSIIITLVADPSAHQKIPGFQTNRSLDLSASAGETLGAVVDRLNTYRGPDAQITELFSPASGASVPFSTILVGPASFVVREPPAR
jgi:hypothetical protein